MATPVDVGGEYLPTPPTTERRQAQPQSRATASTQPG